MTVSSFVRRSKSVRRMLGRGQPGPTSWAYLLRMNESGQACAVDVVHFTKVDDDFASF